MRLKEWIEVLTMGLMFAIVAYAMGIAAAGGML